MKIYCLKYFTQIETKSIKQILKIHLIKGEKIGSYQCICRIYPDMYTVADAFTVRKKLVY